MLDLSKESIKTLSGRDFATLNTDEKTVFDFFTSQGRQHGISVSLVSNAPEKELLQANSPEQYDEVIKRYASSIIVTEGKS